MTNEEELQALREENRTLKALVAELLPLKEQLAQANARIKELEDTWQKTVERAVSRHRLMGWRVCPAVLVVRAACVARSGGHGRDRYLAARGMHDRFASYDAYVCAHSICGAHLVRDCAGVAQQEHQEWASEMQDFLPDLHDACST